MKNLQHNLEDFGISAKWHFTPTAHEKSGPDGVVACKREVCLASLSAKPADTARAEAAI